MMDLSKNITITIPNKDTYIGFGIFCPKEVAQKAYLDRVGKDINFCGAQRKVVDIKVTDEFIFIELEDE